MLRLLFLAAVAVGVLRAWRGRADRDPARIRRALWNLGIAAALARVLGVLASLPLARWSAEALVLGAGLAGGVALAELLWLVEKGARTRDHVVRAILLVVTVGSSFDPTSTVGGTGALLVMGLLAWRWRDALRTAELFAAALGAIGLALLAGLTSGAGDPAAAFAPGSLGAGAWRLASIAWAASLAYAVMGILPVLGAFLRDPSLGIHSVRRRLALSHLLVLLVPLLITIALWILTTWLGVGAERATNGKRVLEHEAAALQRELAGQLDGPAVGAAPAQLRREHGAEWPHLRVWRGEPATPRALVLVMGEALPGDTSADAAALGAWVASADSLPRGAIVQLDRRRYLGAVASSAAHGSLVALAPITEVLAGEPSRLAGARLLMNAEVAARAGAADSSARPAGDAGKSPGRLRVQSVPGTRKPSFVVFDNSRDTIETSDASFSDKGVRGMALIEGLEDRRGTFQSAEFSLRAQVPFAATLLGLYHNIRENPLSVVPIAILALLVALLLPVAIFNFRLVGGLGRSFTQPVAALRAATESLGAGDLRHRVRLEGDDELWQAAAAFNAMAEGLERARAQERQRVRFENELELARRIHERLLPAAPPDVAGLEIAGASESAREVGGDYYDHLPLPDGRVLLVIADVSGKGVPAALLMSAFRAAIMSQEGALTDPQRLAERLNAFLHRSVESGRFVTACFALLDPADGTLQYVNAGHNPALLLHADGTPEWLATGGLLLGILPSVAYERGESRLSEGDLLVLYTDGVTEGADSRSEQFGDERLVATARRLAKLPCAEVARSLVREVRAFEGETGPADDITVLVARSVRLA